MHLTTSSWVALIPLSHRSFTMKSTVTVPSSIGSRSNASTHPSSLKVSTHALLASRQPLIIVWASCFVVTWNRSDLLFLIHQHGHCPYISEIFCSECLTIVLTSTLCGECLGRHRLETSQRYCFMTVQNIFGWSVLIQILLIISLQIVLFVPYFIISVLLSTLVGQMSSTSPVMG